MIYSIVKLCLELIPLGLLAYLWYDEREGWMLIPMLIIASLVIADG